MRTVLIIGPEKIDEVKAVAKALKSAGHKVVYFNKKTRCRFKFTYNLITIRTLSITKVKLLILYLFTGTHSFTNKRAFFERAIELGKPFALLMANTWLNDRAPDSCVSGHWLAATTAGQTY